MLNTVTLLNNNILLAGMRGQRACCSRSACARAVRAARRRSRATALAASHSVQVHHAPQLLLEAPVVRLQQPVHVRLPVERHARQHGCRQPRLDRPLRMQQQRGSASAPQMTVSQDISSLFDVSLLWSTLRATCDAWTHHAQCISSAITMAVTVIYGQRGRASNSQALRFCFSVRFAHKHQRLAS